MPGVLANVFGVIVGSLLGLVFKKGISEKLKDAIMIAVGLCVVYIGISGALADENTIVLVISMALGALIGSLIDIDRHINDLGLWVERKFNSSSGDGSVAKAFVTASLLFCVGAMTVVGSIDAGLGDSSMLYTKSILDFISSIVLTVSLGWGVMLSSVFILVFQGAIALLAGVLEPLLSSAALNEATATGSLLIFAIGLNMVGISKIKVANYMPAIFIAPAIVILLEAVA